MVKRTIIIVCQNVACPRNDLAWSQLAQCLTHACPALAHTFVRIPDMHAHECLCRFSVFLHSHALVVDATATSVHYFLHTLQQSSTKAVHVIVLVYVLATHRLPKSRRTRSRASGAGMVLWSRLTASACTSSSKSFKARSAARRVERRALEAVSDCSLLHGPRPRGVRSEATPAARPRPTMCAAGEFWPWTPFAPNRVMLLRSSKGKRRFQAPPPKRRILACEHSDNHAHSTWASGRGSDQGLGHTGTLKEKTEHSTS